MLRQRGWRRGFLMLTTLPSSRLLHFPAPSPGGDETAAQCPCMFLPMSIVPQSLLFPSPHHVPSLAGKRDLTCSIRTARARNEVLKVRVASTGILGDTFGTAPTRAGGVARKSDD